MFRQGLEAIWCTSRPGVHAQLIAAGRRLAASGRISRVRFAAVRALARHQDPGVAKALLGCLTNHEELVRPSQRWASASPLKHRPG